MTNATTGSERVVPGQQPAGEQHAWLARLVQPVRTHWQFSLVLLAGLVARIVVVLGYPPVFWFSDSYNYLYDAVTHIPDEVRPNGYPFLLSLLLPLHSDYAISALQAAMGLGVAVAIYALLRHRGLPWWGASLPALPVLFDSYELHLEHQVAADTLFMFLVTLAVVMLCWSDRPSVLAMAVAGPAHRLCHPGTVRRRAAARRGLRGHAGPAGRLAPPGGAGRGGRRTHRRVYDLVSQLLRQVRAERVERHAPVQPGQHVCRVLGHETARQPDVPVRPHQAGIPAGRRPVHLGGLRAAALSEHPDAGIREARLGHLEAFHARDQPRYA